MYIYWSKTRIIFNIILGIFNNTTVRAKAKCSFSNTSIRKPTARFNNNNYYKYFCKNENIRGFVSAAIIRQTVPSNHEFFLVPSILLSYLLTSWDWSLAFHSDQKSRQTYRHLCVWAKCPIYHKVTCVLFWCTYSNIGSFYFCANNTLHQQWEPLISESAVHCC